jgi:hypothetical protein
VESKTCPIIFFSKNRAVYEIMWKSSEERGSAQMTIWRMCIACWIRKATNVHNQVVRCLLFFHSNNCCTNAPQCYVIPTLHALIRFQINVRIGVMLDKYEQKLIRLAPFSADVQY